MCPQNDSFGDLIDKLGFFIHKNSYNMKQYFVYVMASKTKTVYIGVTNNLKRRVYEHKQKLVDGFTKKYNITRLVYYEEFGDSYSAIQREKKLKGWIRKKKIALIESINPEWRDLSEGWFSDS